jgi:hypothetical protein
MIHSKFSLLLLTFMSWYDACVSCEAPAPSLPDTPDEPADPPVGDSGEDTGENAPPPACDFPEEEPNSNISSANEIETELWACGVLAPEDESGEGLATDFLRFTVPETGWISMWARGQDIGSYADLQMNVTVTRDDEPMVVGNVEHSPGTLDPKVSFPVVLGDEIVVSISSQNLSASEQQIWEFLAIIFKEPPVYWNRVEDEDVDDPGVNDTNLLANEYLESGDSMFGILSSDDSADVFLLEVPEGSTTIHLDIEAYDQGSPIDARLALIRENPDYDPGAPADDPDAEEWLTVRRDDNGPGADLDLDPEIEVDTTIPGDWRVRVSNPGTFDSKLDWYVLHVTVSDGPEDD